ncbi:sulfatase [Salinigranum sp. GCM10025319]|uniref:sulfatase family protein n=1 Tax=Salinigranum sp. GCM10025319 TaxID=3252687 RepID=UPI003616DFE0
MDGDQPRNLVLVTVDSLRADHCGFVDPESELTPTIDRFASDGVSFTDAIAPGPRTPSSVPVVFTGEFMSDDDDWTMADWQGRQRRIARHMKRFTHLSERLQRRGYETAAFTANPWTTRESNFDFGFDDFFEISADSDDISSSDLSNSTLFKLADWGFESIPGDPVGWSSKKEWFSQWTGYFHLIQSKLRELSEPFFLWVFILDSHQPYITPRQYREECSAWEMYYSILRYWYGEISDDEIPPHAREMIGRTYRDAVRSVDAFVESLFEATDEHDPITVFFSDHGEALGEHGSFGHKQTLYEENVRVPFFVHNAGLTDEVDEQLPLRALPRMLTDLVDPGDFDPRTYTRPFVVSQTENNRSRAVRTERWKLVTDGTNETLYDLASDPDETTDVHAEYDDVASSLRAVVRRHDATQAEKERTGRVAEELVAEGRV